ncbi:MAG: sulfatase family protein [Planctomycetota bacterium]
MEKLTRRKFVKIMGLSATVAAMPKCAPAQRPRRRPNILFIMADDHTSQAIGCYGLRLSEYARTKNIDRIAAEGALLKNCFCTNSICVPSRASILTGQYSHINGAKTLSGTLDPDVDNVAKRLQATGYETAIVGKWHLKMQPSGFDYYNVLRGQGRYNNPILFELGKDWKKGGREHEGHSTDVITDEALAWLNNRKASDKPFCLMCHFKAVHEPFYSHDRYRNLYADQEFPEPEDLFWPESPKGKRFEGWPLEILAERYTKRAGNYAPPRLKVKSKDPKAIRKAAYQKFMRDFLSTVAGIDDNVGRLLAHLDETGQMRDTVVVYTSDQGYFLGEHNMFDKRFMLEESLRMPFVVRYPREIKPGTVLSDIILNIDFAELFLDYAGADVPGTMQGRSFRQNLTGRTPDDWRDAMYYHYWSHANQRPSHYGIRTQRYKLIYYYGLVRMGRKPDECWELYDLQNDPQERFNIYDRPEHKDAIAGLKRRLSQLRRQYKDTKDPLQV